MNDLVCPHCGRTLQPFELPEEAGWGAPFQLACFNDDCPYFAGSWAWMQDHFGVRAAYRYRLDPGSGAAFPLPVWSKDALKDRLLDAVVTAAPAREEARP